MSAPALCWVLALSPDIKIEKLSIRRIPTIFKRLSETKLRTWKPKERKSELGVPGETKETTHDACLLRIWKRLCGSKMWTECCCLNAWDPEEGVGARHPCQCLGEAPRDWECSEQCQLHFTQGPCWVCYSYMGRPGLCFWLQPGTWHCSSLSPGSRACCINKERLVSMLIITETREFRILWKIIWWRGLTICEREKILYFRWLKKCVFLCIGLTSPDTWHSTEQSIPSGRSFEPMNELKYD